MASPMLDLALKSHAEALPFGCAKNFDFVAVSARLGGFLIKEVCSVRLALRDIAQKDCYTKLGVGSFSGHHMPRQADHKLSHNLINSVLIIAVCEPRNRVITV